MIVFSYRDNSYNTEQRKAVQSYPTSYPRPEPTTSSYPTSYTRPEPATPSYPTSYTRPEPATSSYQPSYQRPEQVSSAYPKPEITNANYSKPEISYSLANSYSKTDLSSYSRPEYSEQSYSKPDTTYRGESYSKPEPTYRGESYSKPDYSLYSDRKGSETYSPVTYSSKVTDGVQDPYKVPTYEDRINSVLRKPILSIYIQPSQKRSHCFNDFIQRRDVPSFSKDSKYIV